MRQQVAPTAKGIPRQEPVAPVTRQDGEPKLSDTPQARELRRQRTIARLKKLRKENRDLAELAVVWAAIDLLVG